MSNCGKETINRKAEQEGSSGINNPRTKEKMALKQFAILFGNERVPLL
jgi:hypothetical protein